MPLSAVGRHGGDENEPVLRREHDPGDRSFHIFVARHGRTAWNRDRRRLGRRDEPLDIVGREQAERLRQSLAGRAVDRIVASPLTRALDTARIVATGRDIAVDVDDDLVEFDFGIYEGTSRQVPLKLRRDHRDIAVDGGESLRDAWVRARRVAERVRTMSATCDGVLVVGHHRLNRLLIGALCDMSFDDTLDDSVRLGNGSSIELTALAATMPYPVFRRSGAPIDDERRTMP